MVANVNRGSSKSVRRQTRQPVAVKRGLERLISDVEKLPALQVTCAVLPDPIKERLPLIGQGGPKGPRTGFFVNAVRLWIMANLLSPLMAIAQQYQEEDFAATQSSYVSYVRTEIRRTEDVVAALAWCCEKHYENSRPGLWPLVPDEIYVEVDRLFAGAPLGWHSLAYHTEDTWRVREIRMRFGNFSETYRALHQNDPRRASLYLSQTLHDLIMQLGRECFVELRLSLVETIDTRVVFETSVNNMVRLMLRMHACGTCPLPALTEQGHAGVHTALRVYLKDGELTPTFISAYVLSKACALAGSMCRDDYAHLWRQALMLHQGGDQQSIKQLISRDLRVSM